MASSNELYLPSVTKENICLPLAINVVSKYWNVDLPISEARSLEKKYVNVNSNILIEGIELAERHGLASLILNSSLVELKKIIDMGIPPIVILPGLYQTVQHASVISGYDNIEKTIMHYIPKPDQIGIIPEKQFDKLWSEDNKIMILIAPTDIIYNMKPQNKTIAKSNRLCFMSERLTAQDNVEKAINILKKSINLNKNNVTAFSSLGSLLNKQNSNDCVIYYKKCIAINNKCYLAYRGLGNYFLKNKQFKKAEEYYTKAIEINPERFGPIYKNRGIARLEQNKKMIAKSDFNNYLKYTKNPQDTSSILELLKNI